MDDLSKYERMREQGSSPQAIYLAGKAASLDPITLIRLLRTVCRLSLAEAKEVTVVADGLASSLGDFQAQLIPVIEKALKSLPEKKTRQLPGKKGSKKGARAID